MADPERLLEGLWGVVYALETVHAERYFGESMWCQVMHNTDVVPKRKAPSGSTVKCIRSR